MQPDMTNPLIWFDSHCHFDFAEFDEVREDLVPQLVSNQCGGLVVPGVNTDNWDKLFELKKQYPKFMHIALGLHPYFMEQHHHDDILKLEEFLNECASDIVAIGEIGLDFYQAGLASELDRDRQLMYFSEQLQLAKNHKLPLIVHSRKAHDEVAKVLRITKFPYGGIVHGFSGSLQQAKVYSDLGFVVGLGGALTHDRAKAMQKLVASLSSDQYVLETDAPDMRPSFALDEANSPLNLPKIIQHIAEIRGESELKVRQDSTANLYRVLPAIKP